MNSITIHSTKINFKNQKNYFVGVGDRQVKNMKPIRLKFFASPQSEAKNFFRKAFSALRK
jgi:hypothetical protein